MAQTRIWLAALAGLLLAGGPGARAQELDRIERSDGPPIRATVLHDGYDKLTYRIPGRPEKDMSPALVLQVTFAGLPDAYQQGRAAEESADKGHPNAAEAYETAANSYELAASRDLRPPLKALALYRGAVCRLKLGLLVPARLADAASKLEAFIAAQPGSRMVLEAMLQLGKARRLKGDFKEALDGLKALESKALKENLPRLWEARAKMEQIRVHLAAGKPQDGATLVGSTAKTLDEITPKTPEVEALNLGLKGLEGTILVETKDYNGALRFFQRLLEQGKDQKNKAYLAAAHLGMGETYLARGSAANSSQDLRLAQLSFAQAYVLDGEDGERSAQALYLQAETLRLLGPERAGQEAAGLSKDLYRQVVTQFGASDWAAAARKKMN